MISQAQDLSSHRWNDRLLLILTQDTSQLVYQQQLSHFKSFQQGLKERKLLVYHLSPNGFKQGLDPQGPWQGTGNSYAQYQSADAPFEIILIGLDGGIKLRQQSLLSCETLFGTIDQMPMRKAEMRRDKKP